MCLRGGKSRRSKLQFAGDVVRALAPWADRCIDMIQRSAILISQRKRIVMSFPKIVFIAVWLLSGSVTFGQTAEKKTLTLDGAERVIAAAKAKAQELKSPGGVIAK